MRLFEEQLADLAESGALPGFVPSYPAEEAVVVGACAALRPSDRMTSTYAPHRLLVAQGANMGRMMADLLWRVDGSSRGKGGWRYMAHPPFGIVAQNGVNSGVAVGTGAAWADRQLTRDRVTVILVDAVAADHGVFFESVELAQTWMLPVVFVCATGNASGNRAGAVASKDRSAHCPRDMRVTGESVDGSCVLAVRKAVDRAVTRARTGQGPSLIKATNSADASREGDASSLRTTPREARGRDPIPRYALHLRRTGLLDQAAWEKIELEERASAEDAFTFAAASPLPDPEEAVYGLFAESCEDEQHEHST